jgi:hypothetical protein
MAALRRPASLTPEVFEAIRRQLGVAYRMLNIPVTEVALKSPRIMPLIGQRLPGRNGF